uniref:Carbohydrate kinase PfkB domain-containing protein n=1 Tax=Anopheles atroparvus TaxID=41427 RepID=A0A182IRR6_ANOAO
MVSNEYKAYNKAALDGATYHAKQGTSPGGVARNIAEGIYKIYGNVNLISAVGNDQNGAYIRQLLPDHCASSIVTLGTCPTASFSVLLDRSGDCRLVVGDMAAHQAITPDWASAGVMRRVVARFVHLHLHDQILGLAAHLVRFTRFLVQQQGGQSENQERYHGQLVRPRENVEFRVHQPVAPIRVATEDGYGQEHEEGCNTESGKRITTVHRAVAEEFCLRFRACTWASVKKREDETPHATTPMQAKMNDQPNQLFACSGIHLSLFPKQANTITPILPQTAAASVM